jgi:hypothetical protein
MLRIGVERRLAAGDVMGGGDETGVEVGGERRRSGGDWGLMDRVSFRWIHVLYCHGKNKRWSGLTGNEIYDR